MSEAMRLLAIALCATTLIALAAGTAHASSGHAPGRLHAPASLGLDGGAGSSLMVRPPPVVLNDVPPRVLAVEPLNGSTSVSVSAGITVVFDKTMNRTATEGGFSYTDRTSTFGPANGTFSWSGEFLPDDRLVFNPDENFRANGTYTVRLSGSSVQDRNGLLLDGNENGTADGSPDDDYLWNFTAEPVDATLPYVRRTDPSIAVMGVPVTASLVITFSEAMNESAVAAGLAYTDGASSFTAANGTGSWTLGGEVYTFTPSQSLGYGVTYVVSIGGSAARDLAGNPLDGNRDGAGGDDYTFFFATGPQPDTTRPDVLATIPGDGATRIPIQPTIALVFTEGMNRPSVHGAIRMTEGVTPAAFSWPSDNIVLFTTASALAYSKPYTVTVLPTAGDVAGNRLMGPRTFSFTTTPWVGTVTGSVVDEELHPISNATVRLGDQETLTGSSGGFAFRRIEQGTYPLAVTREGYRTYFEPAVIDETDHDVGAIILEALIAGPVVVPWITVAAIAATAVSLFFLLRRRPKFEEPSPYYWKPTEAVVVPPGEDRPEP